MRPVAGPIARACAVVALIAAAGCGGSELTGTADAAVTDDTARPDTFVGDDVDDDTLVAPDTSEPDDVDPGDTGEPDDVDPGDVDPGDTGEPDDVDPGDVDPNDTGEPDDVDPGDVDPGDTGETDDVQGPDDVPTDTSPPPCEDDDDCGHLAIGPCQQARCDVDTGACFAAPAAEGLSCEDGNLCTSGERCVLGSCVPTAGVVCEDDNPCTDNLCEPASGCRFRNNFAVCEDGDPCTSDDRCAGGVCVAGGPACDDGNPCTLDSCEPDGTCVNTPDDTLTCSDGSACTGGDFCSAGACVPGGADGCDDGNVCTVGACSEDGLSCVFTTPQNTPCDDGDACTAGDRCVNGACLPTSTTQCGGHPACATWTCDPIAGCELVTLNVDAPCSDGDQCTTGDICDAQGDCTPTGTLDCDDDNPCTNDTCSPVLGCRYTAATGPCDDNDACTTDDACSGGQCRGTPRACDDGDPCTLDTCDPLIGCEFLAGGVVCDDGNPCTDDRCEPGVGCVFTPNFAPCDDGDVCTIDDACDEDGACVGLPDPCDDGDRCTLDLCDAEEGCFNVAFTGACDDGDACTTGETCDGGGLCEGGVPVDPDDGVACTIDACDPDEGVTHTPDHGSCAIGEACDLVAGCAAVAPGVLITRVMLDPGVGGDEPGYAQWIVLTNVTDAAFDLAGWTLTNEGGQVAALTALDGGSPPVLPARASIAALKRTAAAAPGGDDGFGLAFGAPGDDFAFDLAGDRVGLLGADEAEVDALDLRALAGDGEVGLDAFPVVAGLALALDAERVAAAVDASDNDDAADWCAVAVAPDGPAPDCGRAVLNEVRLGGGDGWRWVELHLAPGGLADALTLRFLDASGEVVAEVVVTGRMPIGAAILARDGDDDLALPRLSDGAVQLLRDDDLLDVYGFGALEVDEDADLGLPLFEAAPGPTQGDDDVAWRAADGVDSDDNVADWIVGPDGSPGELNGP